MMRNIGPKKHRSFFSNFNIKNQENDEKNTKKVV